MLLRGSPPTWGIFSENSLSNWKRQVKYEIVNMSGRSQEEGSHVMKFIKIAWPIIDVEFDVDCQQ